MTGEEIVALFQQERDAAADKLIERAKADHKDKPEIRVPRREEIRFRLGAKKPRKPTASRIYDAQAKLVEAIAAFPDLSPELIVRAVSKHVLMEPIVIARLWATARARFEQRRAK